jgi:hypothetical protein
VAEPRLRDLGRLDRAAEVVVPLEHDHPPTCLGEQGTADERVDSAADEDHVEASIHSAPDASE